VIAETLGIMQQKTQLTAAMYTVPVVVTGAGLFFARNSSRNDSTGSGAPDVVPLDHAALIVKQGLPVPIMVHVCTRAGLDDLAQKLAAACR